MRAALLAVLVSCGASKTVCDPGETQVCVCSTGDAGAQVCDDAGASWDACDCDGGGSSGYDDDEEEEDTEQPLDSGDASAGADLYATYCAACHGVAGHGGSGPDLRREVPEQSDAELARIITEGEDEMPGFALSDADLADLIAWLRARFGEGSGEGEDD